jgi:hypothetical protein
MTPRATLDQHIDLALEELGRARRLADAEGDLRLSPAELRQPRPQAINVDTAMNSNMQKARDALRPERSRRLGDAMKRRT